MKHLLTFLAFLIIVCAPTNACAAYEDRVSDVGTWLAPVDERIVHGDTHFLPHERAAAERACLEWAMFTRGRVRLHMVWDLDDFNYMDQHPALFRVAASPADGTAGYFDHDRAWVFPAQCPDLLACIMHEYGHILGLKHFEDIPHQVMSAHNSAHAFGRFDQQECERVGVCRDRTLDVTTVTVTVDPSIPRVEPTPPGW